MRERFIKTMNNVGDCFAFFDLRSLFELRNLRWKLLEVSYSNNFLR
jgi:hypothetical protein